MKRSLALLPLLLVLAGCGSGGGGGHGHTNPPPPPPPPVDVTDNYVGTIGTHGGAFASQGNTAAEFNTSTHVLIFETVAYGNVVLTPAHDQDTGWHGNVVKSGHTYAVWFWPAMSHLSITDVDTPSSAAVWTIALVAGSG